MTIHENFFQANMKKICTTSWVSSIWGKCPDYNPFTVSKIGLYEAEDRSVWWHKFWLALRIDGRSGRSKGTCFVLWGFLLSLYLRQIAHASSHAGGSITSIIWAKLLKSWRHMTDHRNPRYEMNKSLQGNVETEKRREERRQSRGKQSLVREDKAGS